MKEVKVKLEDDVLIVIQHAIQIYSNEEKRIVTLSETINKLIFIAFECMKNTKEEDINTNNDYEFSVFGRREKIKKEINKIFLDRGKLGIDQFIDEVDKLEEKIQLFFFTHGGKK